MKIKRIIFYLIIVLIVVSIILFPLIGMMKLLSIMSAVLSGLVVIIALIYEGELKAKKEEKKFLNLTKAGFILVLLFVFMSSVNGYISIKNITDNDNKSKQDSLRFAKKAYDDSVSAIKNLGTSKQIIEDLKTKRKQDSNEVVGLKSDIRRIDTTLVKNALIEIKEQRQRIEQANENTYILFKNEVEANIYTILMYYDDENIKRWRDTTNEKISTVVRLNEESINRFIQISNNETIIDYLNNTLKAIRLVNWFQGTIFVAAAKNRNGEMDRFVVNKNVTLNWLIPIYNMTVQFPHYKDFIASDNIYIITNKKRDSLKADLLRKFKVKDALNP